MVGLGSNGGEVVVIFCLVCVYVCVSAYVVYVCEGRCLSVWVGVHVIFTRMRTFSRHR